MSNTITYAMAIGKDDDTLHVGTIEDLLPHLDVAPVTRHSASSKDLEFFDDTGAILKIDGDDTARLVLEGTAAPTQLLVDRIAVVLAHAQVGLHHRPDPAGQLTRFPILQGDLRTVLAALADFLGPLEPATAANRGENQGNEAHMRCHG
jgi:hypothetical protein